MFKSDWLEFVPGNNIEESIDFLDTLSWNIRWGPYKKQWNALAGDRILVETETKRELEAFILGMTIAYDLIITPISQV